MEAFSQALVRSFVDGPASLPSPPASLLKVNSPLYGCSKQSKLSFLSSKRKNARMRVTEVFLVFVKATSCINIWLYLTMQYKLGARPAG